MLFLNLRSQIVQVFYLLLRHVQLLQQAFPMTAHFAGKTQAGARPLPLFSSLFLPFGFYEDAFIVCGLQENIKYFYQTGFYAF